MQEYLTKLMGFMERFQGMSVDSLVNLLVLGGLTAFGILNVILGYRLLRFWMMLGGFAIGSGLGYLVADMMDFSDQNITLAVTLGIGAALGLIAFLVYRAGIFMLGAGIGLVIGVYVLHPTTSASFFICILAGIALGTLGVKFARPVVIFVTSAAGGILAGFTITKLVRIEEFPYGILIGLVLAALGMLIQFATNKPEIIEEPEETEDTDADEKKYADPEEKMNDQQMRLTDFLDDYEEDLEEDLKDEGGISFHGKRGKNKRDEDAREAKDSL